MVFQTSISFEKKQFNQNELVRGHVDVDIDQYQAPSDGRREDYVCRFKVYGQFSFQQPDFRKSTLPKWKRGRDAIASWQTFIADGTSCEFSVNSKDCPYLLKPGQATRVRSIPFSFHMPGPALPASFVSTHGRAKLEYVISCTTTGKRGIKHSASNTFGLLPSPTVPTFQLYQHNFNVDLDNGGATSPLTISVRNIISVSYPANLLQGSLHDITVTFPNDGFTLREANLTINSKLSIHAVKSTFTIEEDSVDIPCAIGDNSAAAKLLNVRIPRDITESFTFTSKRSAVRKSETLRLVFHYSARTSQGLVHCTSACEFHIKVIGMARPEGRSVGDSEDNSPRTSVNGLVQAAASNSLHLMNPRNTPKPSDGFVSPLQDETLDIPPAEEHIKRSSVRTLRGILKKPRRFSKDAKVLDGQGAAGAPGEPAEMSNAVPEGVIPEISNNHSDEEYNKSKDGSSQSPGKSNGIGSSYKIQRGSLQLGPFDRLVYAKRGAELRDEYMRNLR